MTSLCLPADRQARWGAGQLSPPIHRLSTTRYDSISYLTYLPLLFRLPLPCCLYRTCRARASTPPARHFLRDGGRRLSTARTRTRLRTCDARIAQHDATDAYAWRFFRWTGRDCRLRSTYRRRSMTGLGFTLVDGNTCWSGDIERQAVGRLPPAMVPQRSRCMLPHTTLTHDAQAFRAHCRGIRLRTEPPRADTAAIARARSPRSNQPLSARAILHFAATTLQRRLPLSWHLTPPHSRICNAQRGTGR